MALASLHSFQNRAQAVRYTTPVAKMDLCARTRHFPTDFPELFPLELMETQCGLARFG
jgi:hypothetical protein